MSLGKKLRAEREQQNLGQAEVVRRLGWGGEKPSGRLSNYENDRREPSLNDIRRLAHLYGKRVSHFVDDDPLPGIPDEIGNASIDPNLFAAALDEADDHYRRTGSNPDTLQRVKMAILYYEEYVDLRKGRAGQRAFDQHSESPHPDQ